MTAGVNPLNLNICAYCENDPLGKFDPTGNSSQWAMLGDGFRQLGPSLIAVPGQIASSWTANVDSLQSGMDAAGATPIIGTGVDVINGGIYLARGKYSDAGLCALGLVPIVGDAAQGAKVSKTILKESIPLEAKAPGKAVNLPAWKKVGIDMEHILFGHTVGGSRVSKVKTLFPNGMNESQIERAVREAYRTGKNVGSQDGSILVRGTSGKLTIEMWVNLESKTIETAYPIFK